MKKIRPTFISNINTNNVTFSDLYAKLEVISEGMIEGLYISEFNYLTFDEISYLYETLDKSTEEYKKISDAYENAKILISKFDSYYLTNNLEKLSLKEKEKIEILLGYKTYYNYHKDYVEDFVLSIEDYKKKKVLHDSIVLDRINGLERVLSLKYMKHKFIIFSYYLNQMKKAGVEDEQLLKRMDDCLSYTGDLELVLATGDLTSLLYRYTQAEDEMEKDIYFNIIVEVSEEQKLINELLDGGQRSAIFPASIAHYYVAGGGNSFELKGVKMHTISQKNLDVMLEYIESNKEAMLKSINHHPKK